MYHSILLSHGTTENQHGLDLKHVQYHREPQYGCQQEVGWPLGELLFPVRKRARRGPPLNHLHLQYRFVEV